MLDRACRRSRLQPRSHGGTLLPRDRSGGRREPRGGGELLEAVRGAGGLRTRRGRRRPPALLAPSADGGLLLPLTRWGRGTLCLLRWRRWLGGRLGWRLPAAARMQRCEVAASAAPKAVLVIYFEAARALER